MEELNIKSEQGQGRELRPLLDESSPEKVVELHDSELGLEDLVIKIASSSVQKQKGAWKYGP